MGSIDLSWKKDTGSDLLEWWHCRTNQLEMVEGLGNDIILIAFPMYMVNTKWTRRVPWANQQTVIFHALLYCHYKENKVGTSCDVMMYDVMWYDAMRFDVVR